jgi:hypothetical protein
MEGGGGRGGEMNQAFYANMNNKIKMKKKRIYHLMDFEKKKKTSMEIKC